MKLALLLIISSLTTCTGTVLAEQTKQVAVFQSFNQCAGIDDGNEANLYVIRDANTMIWLDENCEEYSPKSNDTKSSKSKHSGNDIRNLEKVQSQQ